MHQKLSLLLLLLLFVFLKTVSLKENEDEETFRTAVSDSQLKLAYGSMLNVSCSNHDDCLLKHSICNPLTKRCECDIGSMQDNSRCEVIQCLTSNECLDRFPNTVCMFGRCQCRYGLRANGKCVTLEIETVKQLPEWAISMIAVAALLSGVLGGRSQAAAQIVQHVMAIIGLIATQLGRKSLSSGDNSDNGTAPTIACPSLDEHSLPKRHSDLLDSESHLKEQQISLITLPSSSKTTAPSTGTSQVLVDQ